MPMNVYNLNWEISSIREWYSLMNLGKGKKTCLYLGEIRLKKRAGFINNIYLSQWNDIEHKKMVSLVIFYPNRGNVHIHNDVTIHLYPICPVS